MKLTITKEIPRWNKHEINQKKCVIVRFENQTFDWMPTYKQLAQITRALNEIEEESWKNGKETM